MCKHLEKRIEIIQKYLQRKGSDEITRIKFHELRKKYEDMKKRALNRVERREAENEIQNQLEEIEEKLGLR